MPRSVFALWVFALSAVAATAATVSTSTAPGEAPEQKSLGCVVLKPSLVGPESRSYERVLARELFRQAFLLTAREEFGLSTRDSVLREDTSTGSPAASFRVDLERSGPGLTLVPKVYKTGEATPTELWSAEPFRVRDPSPLDYRMLTVRAEELSREGFPGALESAGFARTPARSSPPPITTDLQKQLASLSLVDQYAAVRQVHSIIHTQGPSPELLGALVRGYAHLSVLTESHWNVSHKVFLARAFLYAQRMKILHPNDPSGSLHLAYALTLGGVHGLALEGCAEAKRLAGDRKLPAWLEMIEATCRFDSTKLEKLSESDTDFADLAGLLRLLQSESRSLPTQECRIAVDLLESQPHCLPALALLSRFGPISYKHYSTQTAFFAVDSMIRKEVPRIPGVPRATAVAIAALRPLDKEQDAEAPTRDWRLKRVECVRSLLEAGPPGRDRGEPSWTLLGRMLEEEFFVSTFERALFVKKTLCIDPSDEVDLYLPLLPDHPYRSFLMLCGIPSGEEKRELDKLMTEIVVPDPDIQMWPMFRYIRDAESNRRKSQPQTDKKQRRAPDIYDAQQAAADHISRDLLNQYDPDNSSMSQSAARRLLDVSPHHPIAVAQIVRTDWKSAERQLADWEKEFGKHPAFIREVARHYQHSGPPDLAEKYTKKLIELAPEVDTYRELAVLYWKLHQTDKYVSTLKEALKLPEIGLDHPRVRAELANYYMGQGDYKTALPYAKEAAESGAGDCLLCLSHCYEGMGNMKLAEKWVRECAEHYRSNAYLWFFRCKRTGHGDVEAARQLAESCLVPRDMSRSGEGETYGVYLQLAGEPRQAREAFVKDFRIDGNPNSGMHAAVLAFKMNDRKLHDDLLQDIIDKSSRSKSLADRRAPKIELARLLRSLPTGTLDAEKVDAIVERAPQEEAVNVEYFAGRFFEAYGNQSLADRYLLRAARRTDRTDKFTHVLACDRCRQLGLKITTQPASQASEQKP